MQRICQRANELKQKVSQQTHMNSFNNSQSESIVKQREQIESLMSQINQLQLENNKLKESQKEEKSDVAPLSQISEKAENSNKSNEKELNHQVLLLKKQNASLLGHLRTYENAICVVAEKASEKLVWSD
jgi:predicted  nucleic acid-binding Zn-ribbon protein